MRIGTFFLFRNKIFTEFGGRGNQNFIVVVVVPEKKEMQMKRQTNKQKKFYLRHLIM